MGKSRGVAMKEAVPIGFLNSTMWMDKKNFNLYILQSRFFRHSMLSDLRNRRRSTLVDKLRMHAAAMTTFPLQW